MFLQRSAVAVACRAAVSPMLRRGLATTAMRTGRGEKNLTRDELDMLQNDTRIKRAHEIKTHEDLLPPGTPEGLVPGQIDQATGLERYELLHKLEGVDIFDQRRRLAPTYKGTMEQPVIVRSAGDEQYIGCTGFPVDSHFTIWLTVSRKRPFERCPECGGVYKMDYVGPGRRSLSREELGEYGHLLVPDHLLRPEHDEGHHDHHHEHHGYEEPKTFADYVKPQYW